MSGTSMDGVDGVLADLEDHDLRPLKVLAHAHRGFDPALARELLALNTPGPDEIHRGAQAANALMGVYADVVSQLLALAGCRPGQVRAIGAHGQTVRHQPLIDGTAGYTVQLANGALLAESTRITTVCDFRSADVAAGGQGAPLVPAFHAACFAEAGCDVALLNVGGIANLSLLTASGRVRGFDTGPGNVLMDLWVARQTGHAFDADGRMAASGQVLPDLLGALLCEPYLALPAPKSTGRDLFNVAWLDERLAGLQQQSDADVMATLAEFTACSAAEALRVEMPAAQSLRVCGGGAYNRHLLDRLQSHLPGVTVTSTAAIGVPPDQMEALAFAWLAACRLAGRPASLPAVTGARGPRVLGAVYAAPD